MASSDDFRTSRYFAVSSSKGQMPVERANEAGRTFPALSGHVADHVSAKMVDRVCAVRVRK